MVIGESRIVKALGLAVLDTVITQLEERAERRPVQSESTVYTLFRGDGLCFC